jgi:hypothetical protein
MGFTRAQESLLLAAFHRGNSADCQRWSSCNDQVVTLSLFFTGDISAADCENRFAVPGCVGSLYDAQGLLLPDISDRYADLITLIHMHPTVIQGAGDFESHADPTFTACRLTVAGDELIPDIAQNFPLHPDFASWPNRRTLTDVGGPGTDSSA